MVGAGIAGLSAAWLLRLDHDITLYEAEPRAGGHADTQLVEIDGQEIAVDTGFIVFNEVNYPHLTSLFKTLGVATHDSNMSFGVSIGDGAYEYAGGELRQLFAQPSNIFAARFWRMIRDILHFNKHAPALLDSDTEQSLGDYLIAQDYSAGFIDDYILPMGAAIWSASVDSMRTFPARHFVRFFANHGLLKILGRPQWRTVTGGSRVYVARILADLSREAQLGVAVTNIRREADMVLVNGEPFDQVIFACHADTVLSLLQDATAPETAVLGAIEFQDNEAVLHTDALLMPRRKLAWSSWNYLSHGSTDHAGAICLTYWMNLLQGLKTTEPVLVSLNPRIAIDPAKILLRRSYRHPKFDAAAMRAQENLGSIQGISRCWFAGAWTGWGFHEDGIASAVGIVNALGVRTPWQR